MVLASEEIFPNCNSFVRLHNNWKLHGSVILHFFKTPVIHSFAIVLSKIGWILILHFFHHSIELHTIKVTYQGDDEEQKESLLGEETGGLCSFYNTGAAKTFHIRFNSLGFTHCSPLAPGAPNGNDV